MTDKLQIHVNEKIASRYNMDSFVEIMADACSAIGMNELNNGMIDLRWNSKGKNGKLAQNIIHMTLGMWTVSTL